MGCESLCACGAVCVVPVSVWRRTPQPCFPSRRGRSASRPHRSAIARLRSGAVASRSAPLRGGRSAAGAFSATVGTGARALPCGGHSAPACPCGVGCAPHPPMSGIRLGRNTSRRRLPPLCGDARIPPPERAPAPFPPHVRWRASCTCPFLRCAFRAPYGEQSDELSLNCAGDFLVVHFVDLSHMGNTHRTRQWNAIRKCYSLPPIEPSWNALCKCNNSPFLCHR